MNDGTDASKCHSHELAIFCDRVLYDVLQQENTGSSARRVHQFTIGVNDGYGSRKEIRAISPSVSGIGPERNGEGEKNDEDVSHGHCQASKCW